MEYKVVFFDLDGTLIDSGPAILMAMREMIEELGLEPRSEAELKLLVGPPLTTGFSEVLGLSGELLKAALESFRVHSSLTNLDPEITEVYPGVPEMLKALCEAEICVGVVTSKVEYLAKKQISLFGLEPYIHYFRCADGIIGKTELLINACRELYVNGDAVMIGDRHYDILAAKAAGIDSIAVSYGYGDAEELSACNPTHTVASVAELKELLLNAKLKGV